MGWLWASPSPEKPASPAQGQPPKATPQRATPNEPAADPEIDKFFELFKSEAQNPAPRPSPSSSPSSPSTSTSTSTTASSDGTAPAKSWFAMKPAPDQPTTPEVPPLQPLAEKLLPTEMSCRQAFDQAWACNGLGGQWNAIYRYGEMRSCSEQWDDFWFCMRIKGQTGPVKDEMVRARYREKEWRKYGPGKRSSEDVWEARGEMVGEGEAFNQELDENWAKQ